MGPYQFSKEAVQLVTEFPAPLHDDFIKEVLRIKNYGLSSVDVEILKWNAEHVSVLQETKSLSIRNQRFRVVYTSEVFLRVHPSPHHHFRDLSLATVAITMHTRQLSGR